MTILVQDVPLRCKNTAYISTAHFSSERKLETLAVTHGGDEHDAAVEVFGPIVPGPGKPLSIAAEIKAIEDAGIFEHKGLRIPCAITFSADLKGVEGGRGAGHCCPWCFCDLKHKIPWDGDITQIPNDMELVLPELKRTCKYPVKFEFATSGAHACMPGEELPGRLISDPTCRCVCILTDPNSVAQVSASSRNATASTKLHSPVLLS